MTKAEEVYAKVLDRYPDAELAVREEKAMKFALGRQRIGNAWRQNHLLVSATSELHYDDGTGYKDFQGIVKSEGKDGFAYRVDLGGYTLLLATDGSRRFHPRSDATDEYVEIAVPEFLDKATWTPIAYDRVVVSDQTVTYSSGTSSELRVRVSPRGVKVDAVLFEESAWRDVPGLRFPFQLVGLLLVGRDLVSDRTGEIVGVLPEPYGTDGENRDLTFVGKFSVSDTGLEVSLDMSLLPFPVTIDPTFTVNVAAQGDDGFIDYTFTFSDTGLSLIFGNNGLQWSSFLRYQVNLAQGTTISTAVINAYVGGIIDGGDLTATIQGCNEDNSAQMTSIADFTSRPLTTATASWTTSGMGTSNVAVTTPDFAGVIQEIIDRAGFAANNFMQILIIGASAAGSERRSLRSVDYSGGSLVSELEIVYSTAVPRVFVVIT